MYTELPNVPGTPESRIAALKQSRELLREEPSNSKTVFGIETETPGAIAGPTGLIRLATYIETGHDYRDLHPTGKRRPIIKNIHVTVHPVDPADMNVPDAVKEMFEDIIRTAQPAPAEPETDDDYRNN